MYSPYVPPGRVRNPFLPGSSQRASPMPMSPVSQLSSRLAAASLEDPSYSAPAAIKEGNAFYLPNLDESYLADSTFEAWKAMWDKQVAETKANEMPEPQLKRILLSYVKLPMNRQFWKNSYSFSIEQVFAEIKKKCNWYRPEPAVLQLIKKNPEETYDEYLSRHLLQAEQMSVSYSDSALCTLLYSIIPPELRCLVEKEWSENKPADMAAKIDMEILRRRGRVVGNSEIQPLMFNMDATLPQPPANPSIAVMAYHHGCTYCGDPRHDWKTCKKRLQGIPPVNPDEWIMVPKNPQKKNKKRNKKKKKPGRESDNTKTMNAVSVKSTNQQPSTGLVDDLMYIGILVNNTPTDALLDQGSQVTAISDKLYNQLAMKPRMRKPSIAMEGAAKNCHLTVIGGTTVTLDIGVNSLFIRSE